MVIQAVCGRWARGGCEWDRSEADCGNFSGGAMMIMSGERRPPSFRVAMGMLAVLVLVVVIVVVQSRLALARRSRWSLRLENDAVSWAGPTRFLLGVAAPRAQAADHNALGESFFAPELVMRNEQRIKLKPEQRTAITEAVQQLQTKVVDLQSRMEQEGERLAKVVHRDEVSEGSALGQLDRVLAVERDLKRARIVMLIRVKNTLAPEQQEILRGLPAR
jgi:hypothetical protein